MKTRTKKQHAPRNPSNGAYPVGGMASRGNRRAASMKLWLGK